MELYKILYSSIMIQAEDCNISIIQGFFLLPNYRGQVTLIRYSSFATIY